MKILVTGANGFVGKNLVENLKNIRDGKNRTRPGIAVDALYTYDVDSDPAALSGYCADCDFVFHLAGVNRPKDVSEFSAGNVDFTARLLSLLREHKNTSPVLMTSSIQATLQGRFAGSPYGESKAAAEALVFEGCRAAGAKALVFRLPNLFGKWGRPGYNSVVATFCWQIARGQPITVNDPNAELELLYIDDLIETFLNALEGKVRRCNYSDGVPVESPDGAYCFAPGAHKVRLGDIADMLQSFSSGNGAIALPEMPAGSFIKKLYAAYLSYLPSQAAVTAFQPRTDERGSFTELIKTAACGQFSVNVSNPGVTKGQHWHNSKWELFIVVSGQALIRQRAVGTDEVLEFRVSGDEPTAVRMLPGYTHSIENLSKTEKLVTLMWANETFDPLHPDTFAEPV